jgi:type I restriction enzyme S subunit
MVEQQRMVREADRLESTYDEVAHIRSSQLVRIGRLRPSILKWAFEGKLADQDPSDEPASVLLARIKAERDKTQPAKKKSRA